MLRKALNKLRVQAANKYLENILSLVEESRGGRLLDCGCHDGEWTRSLSEKGKYTNGTVFGIETNDQVLEHASKNGVIVKNGDLNKSLDFGDETFEMVHANQVIEHLYDTGGFLNELFRVTQKGGYIIICTENLSSWHNIVAQILGYQPFSLTNISPKYFGIGNPLTPNYMKKLDKPSSWLHVRVFSYRGLIEHIEEFGFEVEEVLGAGYYPINFMAKYDARHSAFLTIKARKK